MMAYKEALEIVLSCCNTLSTEKVYLAQALGRVLAEDIVSDEDRPSLRLF